MVDDDHTEAGDARLHLDTTEHRSLMREDLAAAAAIGLVVVAPPADSALEEHRNGNWRQALVGPAR
ncbi:hypothetical protein HUO13_28560 [Saccharopolyspora erythraea]|uniref:hypothetical protein n=1 Tax=Saccharopolyspora erythraea TaxID=1836 RepID=UPI001BA6A857|nr:hypothetical protein [Saccharopolyspora erythraea]QUH04218.1 hypothetical protein HUO13_28560 [Saccharopolyspora erythraea]